MNMTLLGCWQTQRALDEFWSHGLTNTRAVPRPRKVDFIKLMF